jgi:hypothetical protein
LFADGGKQVFAEDLASEWVEEEYVPGLDMVGTLYV